MKNNMYEFVTKTWNPLAGECKHGCRYCSTNSYRARFAEMRAKYSGAPRIDERQIKRKFKPEDTVFVASQNDLFSENVPLELIARILQHCELFDSTFLLQTKNPKRYAGIPFAFYHSKYKLGVTIESDIWYPAMGNSPMPANRIKTIISNNIPIDFVTIEPIMGFSDNFIDRIRSIQPRQVNIGADSKRSNLPEPPKDKILKLISGLEAFTKVHLKSNLKRLLK